ncbi:GNAT family N-acetyltransferase [Dietzia sp. B32]|uniref:GNAT family N-acetyltransferase n=1 Tax=Dietzia sp. B32 TaxID=2915130 RepID=UPI0021AD87BE|nr:GNAT family N-acetyltransferase [Dietzia sp. B32]UVE94088.1 GNAT family N-acetyltransferase [Dietzia sp. B32]
MSIVEVTSPAPRERWRELVASSDSALPEHAPGWTDALCATGRYADVSRHYSFEDGGEALLPLVARRGPTGIGGWAGSYPAAWGIGGPLDTGLSTDAARSILRDLRGLGCQRIGIRPNPLDGPVWVAAARAEEVSTIPRRAHVLDLSAGVEAVWAGMNQSGRRNVRLARRAGVRLEVGSGGTLLDEYYELFLSSIDRWAEKQREPRALARARARRRDPLSKLRTMGDRLGEDFRVILAHLDGAPVAGAIVLYGPTGHGTRAAMDGDRIGKSHASELVYWTAIELACESGCSTFHMGESGRSKALAQAKEKFGARAYDYAELRIERLPWTRMDTVVRTGVKRLIGFADE